MPADPEPPEVKDPFELKDTGPSGPGLCLAFCIVAVVLVLVSVTSLRDSMPEHGALPDGAPLPDPSAPAADMWRPPSFEIGTRPVDDTGVVAGRSVDVPDVLRPDSTPSPVATTSPPAAQRTVGPAPTRAPFAAVDECLEELRQAQVAFNVPERMRVKSTETIRMLLSLQATVADMVEALGVPGGVHTADVRAGPRMEARLTGPSFSIVAATKEVQAVSSTGTTEWTWDITAL